MKTKKWNVINPISEKLKFGRGALKANKKQYGSHLCEDKWSSPTCRNKTWLINVLSDIYEDQMVFLF